MEIVFLLLYFYLLVEIMFLLLYFYLLVESVLIVIFLPASGECSYCYIFTC